MTPVVRRFLVVAGFLQRGGKGVAGSRELAGGQLEQIIDVGRLGHA